MPIYFYTPRGGVSGNFNSLETGKRYVHFLMWDKGVLRPSYDITDDLMCRNMGPIIYDMSRDEIGQFFGAPLVAELDALREQNRAAPTVR